MVGDILSVNGKPVETAERALKVLKGAAWAWSSRVRS